MPKTASTLSDAEFIEVWRACGGRAAEVAKRVGIGVRETFNRRRRVEDKLKMPLPVTATPRPDLAARYSVMSPREHKPRLHAEISTGIVLVFSDAHFWPGIRSPAFRALVMFAENLKPSAIVCNGDAFDGASVSRWPRIGWDSKPSVKEEIKACTERLTEIEDAAGKARLFWPLGNHDARFETRLAQVAPEFEGIDGFHLKDKFPKWAPCWSLFVNGCTVIKHRFKGGIHATHNNTIWSGKTIVTGHLHSLKVTPFSDYNGTRWGVDTGTLADPYGPQFVDYSEDSPKNHRSGFAVLTYHKGVLLTPEVARVIDDSSIDFRGQIVQV